jgi:dihydrofolate synthase / folylpolyglutamate synthase
MRVENSDTILKRLLHLHPKKIDLVLDRVARLLADLGHPEARLPPVLHVAGTNGKGSACAFARAMLEAAGNRVAMYTSPHLVRFHERIRLPGGFIGEEALAALLAECEEANGGAPITFFEITTAAAFLAFSRGPADALVVEVGLGGIYDATNVIARPKVCCIMPVGLDHAEFLGTSLAGIAHEKAGIIKPGVPVVVAPQTDEALDVILAKAEAVGAPTYTYGQDFQAYEEHGRMVYQDTEGLLDLPPPRLAGRHQIENAAVVIAAMRRTQWVDEAAIETGLTTVVWPARMQRLSRGPLVEAAPPDAEVWLDGGHNPHGAAAVARALTDMAAQSPKPLFMIAGMLNTKDSTGYFAQFKALAPTVTTVAIAGEAVSRSAEDLCAKARAAGLDAQPAVSLLAAMARVAALAGNAPSRVLVCGSLHLAGVVLRDNG